MKYKLILVIACLFLFFNGCSQPAIYSKTKMESTLYEEKLVKFDGQRELNILCDYCNLEIYSWDNQEIKFEMKKRVRGVQEKSKLDEKLKDFNVYVNEDEASILFKSQYKGSIKSSDDKILDLRIYVPKKIKNINIKMDKGYLKLLDDMKCNLKVDAKIAHMELNRIIGSVKLNLETGNVKIGSGKISGDSEIRIGTGNIYVKSQYEKDVKCLYETKAGNIELYMPTGYNFGMELFGTVEVNELTDLKLNKNFVVRSDIGKISLRSFK